MPNLLTNKVRYLIHPEHSLLKRIYPSDVIQLQNALKQGWKEVTMEEYFACERWYLAGRRDLIEKISEVLK